MILNSIRGRLLVWYGLILCVVVGGFGYGAYRLESAGRRRDIDDKLRNRLGILTFVLPRLARQQRGGDMNDGDVPPPPLRGFQLSPEQAAQFDDNEPHHFYYVLWRRDGPVIARSDNAPETSKPDKVSSQFTSRNRGGFREMYFATPPGDVVLAGCSTAPEKIAAEELALSLAGIGAAILLLGLIGGWYVASQAINPIETISVTAIKISEGDLSQRIELPVKGHELERLAAVLNSAFTRLESTFAQRRQFVSDAAHELRTPVSVMLVETQGALKRPRTIEEYRQTVEICYATSQRMRRLTESLLALARLDDGGALAQAETCDLAELAAECIGNMRSLTAERHITISSKLGFAPFVGDGESMTQVITNLISNAIYYNRDHGSIEVETREEAGSALLLVRDTGIGIGAEHLSHIFDRFYRVDASRATSAGRTGLGLAISQSIVAAHGGGISVESKLGAGSTFVVLVPTKKRAE
jgi:heavy metal sensor kinase